MDSKSQQQDKSGWKVPFFTIWTGQAFSLVGSRVAMFALIWWLTETTGSATVLATASLVAMLPQIVLGPIAGAYVDRWNRRLVMMVADSAIALVSLWLAVLFWTGSIQIWHVYVIMVVRELGGIFHWPAMQSSTSLMVPKEHLARVSGLNQAMNGGLTIIGPALGALLLSVLPIHSIMMMDVASAAFAIVPLFFVAIPQPERATNGEASSRTSIWADMREAAAYLAGWRGLVMLSALAMVIKIALTPAFALMPILVTQRLGGAAPELAGLESAVGVGILVGGLLLGVWGGFKRRIYTTMVAVIALGIMMLVIGSLPPEAFVLAMISMFLMGASIAMIDGPLFAVLQSTVEPDKQGRVFMLFGSLVAITSPIGLAIAGPVTDLVGVQVWYLIAGALCVLMGLVGNFMPSIVHIEDHAQKPAPEANVAAATLAAETGD